MSSTPESTSYVKFNIEHLARTGMQGATRPHWHRFDVSEYGNTVLLNFRHLLYSREVGLGSGT